jgi:predicted alpha/beta-fold hydrolase
MPHLHSTYQAPTGLNNGHLQTLIANFRRVAPLPTQRERIFTDDQDFLDLDWYCKGSSRLALLSHGLEGHSQRPYMIGMAQTLSEQGWDVLLWNYRSCSGELNWKVSLYHSGATEDLHHVLQHVLQRKNYKTLILIGFSLGGNLALKYLGQYPLPSILRTGIFFSVPCDLKAASEQLAKPAQRLYMQEFLRSFHQKIRQKSKKKPSSPLRSRLFSN